MRWLALLLFFITPALAEPAITGNVLPALSEFSTSGSTTSNTTSGCTAGQFCTGNAAAGGGTYTSSFSVPLTTAEIRQGFTLNSAVTVDSHPSNASLASCTSLTQIGDCRDVFRLTVSLFDGLDLAEKFEREVELDFSGLQNFTFQDTVAANSFDVLLGEFSLFGIDAGFQSGFFGPKFSSPDLTISYQTVVEQQILDQIAQATEIVTASLAPPPPPPPTETVAASQTAGPPPPATTIATLETQAPAAPPPPTIEPVAPPPHRSNSKRKQQRPPKSRQRYRRQSRGRDQSRDRDQSRTQRRRMQRQSQRLQQPRRVNASNPLPLAKLANRRSKPPHRGS